MTENVQIVLIADATVVLVVVLTRFWSHREHGKNERIARRTEAKVDELIDALMSARQKSQS